MLRDNANIVGIVEDSGEANDAVESVARGVASAIAGINGTNNRRSCSDLSMELDRQVGFVNH